MIQPQADLHWPPWGPVRLPSALAPRCGAGKILLGQTRMTTLAQKLRWRASVSVTTRQGKSSITGSAWQCSRSSGPGDNMLDEFGTASGTSRRWFLVMDHYLPERSEGIAPHRSAVPRLEREQELPLRVRRPGASLPWWCRSTGTPYPACSAWVAIRIHDGGTFSAYMFRWRHQGMLGVVVTS
jgi:hypothetical protein